MGTERILVMNLGSTSSKIAVYDDDKEVFNDTIRHTTEELASGNQWLPTASAWIH